MIKLDSGNVLLKPSHRRQMNAWLKRSLRLGQRVGKFDLQLSLQRVGRSYEARAQVRDQAGDFDCRSRKREWRDAVRLLAADISNRLHDQHVQQMI
jgi:hypothetical protein